MGKLETRIYTFGNGDEIRCKETHGYRKGKWIDVFSCEWEKKGYKGMGLIHEFGEYNEININDIEGEIEKKEIGDEMWTIWEFEPLENCSKTVHKCIRKLDASGYDHSLECWSFCERGDL